MLVPAQVAGQRVAALLEDQFEPRGTRALLEQADQVVEHARVIRRDDEDDVGFVPGPAHLPLERRSLVRWHCRIAEIRRASGQAQLEAAIAERVGVRPRGEQFDRVTRESDVHPRRAQERVMAAKQQPLRTIEPPERDHVFHRRNSGHELAQKRLGGLDLADPQKQEVLVVFVEARNDVALDIVLRCRVEHGLRRRTRHVRAHERRQDRNVDVLERDVRDERELGERCRIRLRRRFVGEVDLADDPVCTFRRSERLDSHRFLL